MATEPTDTGHTLDTEPSARSIGDIHINEFDSGAVLKFVAAFAIGAFFFL